MLASKFFVFGTNRILYNVSKFPLYRHRVKLYDKTLRCNRSNKSDSNITKYQSNTCDTRKQNSVAHVRCSQNTPTHLCHGKQKWKTITIVSDYEKSRRRINDRIKAITKFIDEEKRTIIESLEKEARVDKNGAYRWLKSISDDVNQKLQQVIELDPCFGSEIRVTVLRFKDHAKNTFFALHCDLAPSVKYMESILEGMQTETSQCLQKAAVLTLLCRCNGSPSRFKKCFLDNTAEAEKILERTMEEVKIKLSKIKKLRNYMLKCHREALDEETHNHSSKMQTLSQYLDDCIAILKKLNK